MSRLKKLMDKLRKERQSGKRIFRHGDPAIGLEYNGINATYLVSQDLWKVDIARTPQVIKEIGEYVDVHGEAWRANNVNTMVNYRASKFFGRGRF
jgi:hypothetical protein